MKKSFLLTLAFLCSMPFLTFAQQTSSNPGIIAKTSEGPHQKSFVIQLANLQKKPTRIMIRDEKGYTHLSNKVTDHNGYRMLVDMTHIAAGSYTLYVLHPEESVSATIELKKDAAEVVWKVDELIGMK